MSFTVPIVALVIAFGALVAMTTFGVAWIEAVHPPAGQFVEVEGVRLHVAETGLARHAPGAEPAVVLIHGASGNMEDMRLALGERLAASHRVILSDRPGHGWSSRPADDLMPRLHVKRSWLHRLLSNSASGARFWSAIPGVEHLRQPTRSRFLTAPPASYCSPPLPILGLPTQAGITILQRYRALVRCFYARLFIR